MLQAKDVKLMKIAGILIPADLAACAIATALVGVNAQISKAKVNHGPRA